MTIAGVDAHRDSHSIAFIDAVGKVVGTLTIPTTIEGYHRAIALGKQLGTQQWGLEGTGSYSMLFAQQLVAAGMRVYEVPGSFTKRHRRHASRRGKSDALDAQAIAEAVLREGDRLSEYHYSPEREAIRLRSEQRDRLVRERTMAINRLRAAALRLGMMDLPATLNREKTLQELQRHVKRLRGNDLAGDALIDDVSYAIEDIRTMNARVKEINDLLDPWLRRIAPELLAIFGVSTVTAAGLVGHAGSRENTRNADAFAMRCGTAPLPCSSGARTSVRVNPSGNRQLNRYLHVIALTQIRSKEHPGRVYYDRKRTEGQSHRAAMRSLKRQLTKIVYYTLLPAWGRLASPPHATLSIAA